ncbi:MAG: WG repeat-containing protein [Alistipes sp.]|nr:WG repeat-containing protein [Alistipes sp.]
MGDFSPNGLAFVKLGDEAFFINEKGERVLDCKYDWANIFSSCGLSIVETKSDLATNNHGLINDKGEEIVPCEYSMIDVCGDWLVATNDPTRKMYTGCMSGANVCC